jgi:ThiF family
MTLPRFLRRITDAASPLLSDVDHSVIGARLESVTVALRIDTATATLGGYAEGYRFAVRMAARLYPTLVLDAPPELRKEALNLARKIHPGITIPDESVADVELGWGFQDPSSERITVSCEGWTIRIDDPAAMPAPCSAAVAMAAAAIGMSEVFRAVFAEHLDRGPRDTATPWTLNLVTGNEHIPELPQPSDIDVGTVHLVGCGAVGQAAVAALGTLRVRGTLVAVDHEAIDEGNLQRYVLALDADIGKPKTNMIERALKGSRLKVRKVPTRWGEDERSGPGAETVLVAVDSKRDRIGVQASLPRVIYNAWTQPDEAGFSRHERFGVEPCLACLYWPRGSQPSYSELIAKTLGVDELRVLGYLNTQTPVGQPLPPESAGMVSLRLPGPPDPAAWTSRSLLQDIATTFGLVDDDLPHFAPLGIGALYSSGVCGELLQRGADGRRDEDVSVPLAHQSALAGVLLAIGLVVAKTPELRVHRPAQPLMHYDILHGAPQELPSPEVRYPPCFCHDPDFLEAYAECWAEAPIDQA